MLCQLWIHRFIHENHHDWTFAVFLGKRKVNETGLSIVVVGAFQNIGTTQKKPTPWKGTPYIMNSGVLRNMYIYYIHLQVEPKWPLFWLKFGPCFGGLTFKNRGQLGSRYKSQKKMFYSIQCSFPGFTADFPFKIHVISACHGKSSSSQAHG